MLNKQSSINRSYEKDSMHSSERKEPVFGAVDPVLIHNMKTSKKKYSEELESTKKEMEATKWKIENKFQRRKRKRQ